MKVRGIGGHLTEMPGIAEDVQVTIGKVSRSVHFWVARGPVQLIIGKPFLMDASANINYNGAKGESLSIKDSTGQNYLVPIIRPNNQKWETTLPSNFCIKDFLV